MSEDNVAIVNPKKFIAYLKSSGFLKNVTPPSIVIIVFLNDLIQFCQKKHTLQKIDGFDAGELYLLADHPAVGVFYCRGIGAPAAVVNFEELIAFGVQSFIVISTAGSLQTHLALADIVVCSAAISEEGTSKHYLADLSVTQPSLQFTEKFLAHLSQENIACTQGKIWTTDAPYRETKEKVLAYQNQGVLAVEMEISALYNVATFHQVHITAACVISDSLADLSWMPGFFSPTVNHALQNLMLTALDFAQRHSQIQVVSAD